MVSRQIIFDTNKNTNKNVGSERIGRNNFETLNCVTLVFTRYYCLIMGQFGTGMNISVVEVASATYADIFE